MKFCNVCGTLMQKTTVSGTIKFECVCKNVIDGSDEDTLMYEEILETSENFSMYETYVRNSAYDAAGYRVEKKCEDCGKDYMTMVRIGDNEIITYVCDCGRRD